MKTTFSSRMNDRRTSGTVICLISAHPTRPAGFTSDMAQETLLTEWGLVTASTVDWSGQTESQHHYISPSKARNAHPRDPQPQHHRERHPLTEDMDHHLDCNPVTTGTCTRSI
ncbi:hypothetical protein ACOMHN_016797 [Nucella lapillus]